MSFDAWKDGESHDNRSDDAKAFGLPVNFQGPTFFRFDQVAKNGTPYGVALFLTYGTKFQAPSACLAVVNGKDTDKIWLGEIELQNFAGVVLDVADARSKEHLTISDVSPSTDLARLRVLSPMPTDQLERLVGAFLDASDALDTYGRVGRFPIRHAYL